MAYQKFREFRCPILKKTVSMDFTVVEHPSGHLELGKVSDCFGAEQCGVKHVRQLAGGPSAIWSWEKCPVNFPSLVQDEDIQFR